MVTHALILSLVVASGGERMQPRLRGGIGAVFSTTLYVGGFSPGLDAAPGATFADKYGLEVRFIGVSTSFAVDLALHEQVYLSAGLGFAALGGGVFQPRPPRGAVRRRARAAHLALHAAQTRTSRAAGPRVFLALAPGAWAPSTSPIRGSDYASSTMPS